VKTTLNSQKVIFGDALTMANYIYPVVMMHWKKEAGRSIALPRRE